MKQTRAVLLLIALASFCGALVSSTLQQRAAAARNSSGTYTLPAGNPVTTKTTITSAWANSTLSDIGTELTNSLDRSGRGAMSGQLQLAAGTVSAPGLTFGAENASGLYRAGAGDLRMSVGSTDVEKYAATGVTIPGILAVTGVSNLTGNLNVNTNKFQVVASNGNTTVAGTLGVTGDATLSGNTVGAGDVVVDSAAANAGTITGAGSKVLRFGSTTAGEGIASKRTAGGNQFGLDIYTGGNQRVSITNTGGFQIPGSSATNPGTAITAIYGTQTTVTGGSLTADACATSTITVNGVTNSGVCVASWVGTATISAYVDCQAAASNQVNVRVCTLVAQNVGNPLVNVRVFQP